MTDYPRNIQAAIAAHQIRKSELDALVSSGPTVCPAHNRPYAGGALWHGCKVCAECMREEAAALRRLRGAEAGARGLYGLVTTDASRFMFLSYQAGLKARRSLVARKALAQSFSAGYWRTQAWRAAKGL